LVVKVEGGSEPLFRAGTLSDQSAPKTSEGAVRLSRNGEMSLVLRSVAPAARAPARRPRTRGSRYLRGDLLTGGGQRKVCSASYGRGRGPARRPGEALR
jgi:hypothetical protein